MPSIISSLTPNEREALAICGIQKDEQLAKTDPDTLLRDLQEAKITFPGAAFDISEDKLRSLCGNATQAAEQAEGENPPDSGEGAHENNDKIPAEAETKVPGETFRTLPELSPRHHHHHTAKHHTANLWEAPGVDNSVHCSHPIRTYLAALSMVSFYAGTFSLILLPFMIIAGYVDSAYIIPCTIAVGMLLLPYLFIGIRCYCCVCKMRFFRLLPYNTNRHAHVIPFLGMTAFVTALHIVFYFWYRCPACGTAIRLFRSRHHRHSH